MNLNQHGDIRAACRRKTANVLALHIATRLRALVLRNGNQRDTVGRWGVLYAAGMHMEDRGNAPIISSIAAYSRLDRDRLVGTIDHGQLGYKLALTFGSAARNTRGIRQASLCLMLHLSSSPTMYGSHCA